MWYGDDGWCHDDFEGSYAHDEMGYDENDIYDAFDGDPMRTGISTNSISIGNYRRFNGPLYGL